MATALHDDLFATRAPSLHEHTGFELGWDYAHHRLLPPAPYAQEPSPLRDGLLAGQASFGVRTLEPTRHVRKWLQLRLHAWLRGRSVELVQVTPHYLKQLEVSHCPVTRELLSVATLEASDASIDRVRNDAGYAAGNLVSMSTRANRAKGTSSYRDAQRLAAALEAGALQGGAGLTAAQWSRISVLCSFVEPLPHEEACTVPLLVLPPNRLRLFNPAQALAAFVSRQLLLPGWSLRTSRIEALIPGKPARRAFQTFFHALLPRVLETAGRGGDALRVRWAVEDAWRNALVQRRWAAFAGMLSAEQCEAIVTRATARRLGTQRAQPLTAAQATEGWNLATRGYVPHAALMQRRPAAAGAPTAKWAGRRGSLTAGQAALPL